jgi:hypothetical protein
MNKDFPFYGQVIIEKGFNSREAAQQWMDQFQLKYRSLYTSVEAHLWETDFAHLVNSKKLK